MYASLASETRRYIDRGSGPSLTSPAGASSTVIQNPLSSYSVSSQSLPMPKPKTAEDACTSLLVYSQHSSLFSLPAAVLSPCKRILRTALLFVAYFLVLLTFLLLSNPIGVPRTAMPPVMVSRLHTYSYGYRSPSLSSTHSTPRVLENYQKCPHAEPQFTSKTKTGGRSDSPSLSPPPIVSPESNSRDNTHFGPGNSISRVPRMKKVVIVRAHATRSDTQKTSSENIKMDGHSDDKNGTQPESSNANDWQILGLMPGADMELVKKSYRALVKLHHPDTGGDEQRFELIKSAFEKLMGRKTARMYSAGAESDGLQKQVQPLIDEGMNLYEMNDIASALRQLKNALTIWKEKGLPMHPKGNPLPFWVLVLANNVIGMQRAVARECARQGDFQAALLVYREVLELNKDYTRSTYTLIYVLNQMAQLEGALGRHKQARGYFFEVLDIIEAEEGKPLKGEVLANLANDYSLDRDLLNSLKTYDKALETLLERKSASDAYTLEAPQSTEQSRVAILPKRTPVTEALSQAGRNYVILCSRVFAEAMESPTDIVSIQKCGYFLRDHCTKTEAGSEGITYGLLLKAWGTGMSRAGNKTLASVLLNKAVEILTVHLGESIEVADAMQELGACIFDMRNKKGALDKWIIAYQMMANAMGGNYQNVETAQIGTKIAAVFLSLNEPDKALNFLGVTLNTLLKILPPEDVRVVNAQKLLPLAQKQLFEKDGTDPEIEEEEEFLDPEWNALGVSGDEEKSGIHEWNEKQVLDWAKYVNLNDVTIDILRKQCIDGPALATYDINEMIQDGIPRGQAIKIRRFIDQDKIREFLQRQTQREESERDRLEKAQTLYPNPREIKNLSDLDLFGIDLSQDIIGSIIPGNLEGRKVACKVVSGSRQGIEALKASLKIPLNSNCVELLGVAVINEFILLILPWYELGTVREAYVNTTKGTEIISSSLEFIEKVALPSAQALAHLHAHMIIHRDVSGQNMMVSNEEGKAVLHEWGKAKFGTKKFRFEGFERDGEHPVRWIAPEGIAGNFSFASDVWSLAVTWSEVLNQDPTPYSDQSPTSVIAKVCAGRLIPKLNPEIKNRFPVPFLQLYRQMLRKDPAERPSAKDIVTRLRFLRTKLKLNANYGLRSTNQNSDDGADTTTDDDR